MAGKPFTPLAESLEGVSRGSNRKFIERCAHLTLPLHSLIFVFMDYFLVSAICAFVCLSRLRVAMGQQHGRRCTDTTVMQPHRYACVSQIHPQVWQQMHMPCRPLHTRPAPLAGSNGRVWLEMSSVDAAIRLNIDPRKADQALRKIPLLTPPSPPFRKSGFLHTSMDCSAQLNESGKLTCCSQSSCGAHLNCCTVHVLL